jgi:hypothetical protein
MFVLTHRVSALLGCVGGNFLFRLPIHFYIFIREREIVEFQHPLLILLEEVVLMTLGTYFNI